MLDPILDEVSQMVQNGQKDVASAIERLVYLMNPELHSRLKKANANDAFLEPLGIVCLASGGRTCELEQQLAGYAVHGSAQSAFTVSTDAAGRCYVPRVGYFETTVPNRTLKLGMSLEHGFRLELQGEAIPFLHSHCVAIPGTRMELAMRSMPALDYCFAEARCTDVHVDGVGDEHVRSFARAASLVRRVWPTMWGLLDAVVRRAVIFAAPPECSSFALPAAHGTIFSNSTLGRDEVFFVEDLVHQGGHVVLSGAGSSVERFFGIPPSTRVGEVFHRRDDRTIYVVLHSLVTEALVAKAFDLLLGAGAFHDEQRHEAQGRLAFMLRKFRVDAKRLSQPRVLSAAGKRFVGALEASCSDIAERRARLLHDADFANQAYNFDYALYAERNGSVLV